ncbi:NAD(P)-binding protein [Cystobasidium minutum MCA 4210]|uniref:NAD(P)-binding protein n=1 Tax=Cystobasidium minutum MCA 4210 TaxID=1397322 RepID=UPI0034CDF80C|eukprot:jgi/Rhomi1/10052/CE10051_5045
MVTFKRIVLAERPETDIQDNTFKTETAPLPDKSSLKDDEVLIKVEHLSLDPAMRGWLRDTRSYLPPVKIGEVMRAGGLGSVVALGPNVKSLKEGDHVEGILGWQEYSVVSEKTLTKRVPPQGAQLTDYLGVLGMPGQTAYWGITDVGQIKPGETVVVSGAAGAVGSTVCQIAKLRGCNVVGIAGGKDKCEWLEKDLGIKAIDYKASNFHEEFKKIGYLDVYFDNVGGDMLDFALTRLKQHARIVLCGAISDYNSVKPKGLSSYLSLIAMRGRLQGFIVFDYKERYAEAEKEMAQWIAEGKLKRRETVLYGIENCVKGLQGIFKGANTGKMLITLDQQNKARI